MFYCFHVAALLFMSAQPILGHFLLIFMVFRQNYQKLQILVQNYDALVILNISLPFWLKILSWRQLSIFG